MKSKYKLHMLKEVGSKCAKFTLANVSKIEDLIAEAVQVNTPFNNPITGFCAFTHKSGIHQKGEI